MINKLGEWFVRYLYTCLSVVAVAGLLIEWHPIIIRATGFKVFVLAYVCALALYCSYRLDTLVNAKNNQ